MASIIQIENLKETRKALKMVGEGVDDLKAANLAAAELVRAKATAKMPKKSGALAASYKAKGLQTGGVVSSKLIYAGVQEFGGKVRWRPRGTSGAYPLQGGGVRSHGGRSHMIPVKPKAPNESYYIYPTLREEQGGIEDEYTKELDRIIRKHFGG